MNFKKILDLRFIALFVIILSLFIFTACSSIESKAKKGWNLLIDTYKETYNMTDEHAKDIFSQYSGAHWLYLEEDNVIIYRLSHKSRTKFDTYFIYYLDDNHVDENNAEDVYYSAFNIADNSGYLEFD